MRRMFFYGVVASVVGGAVMFLSRLTLGTLTIPEVLVDWVTSLVPLDLFSRLVGSLGVWAKQGLVAGLVLVLMAASGAVSMLWYWLQQRWPGLNSGKKPLLQAILVALLLWLFAMVVVLPASGRGIFGLLLKPWPVAMVSVWLLSALVYAFVLLGLYPKPLPETPADTTRRLFLKRLTYSIAGLAAAAALGAGIWKIISGLAGRTISSLTGKLPPEITPTKSFYIVSKNSLDPKVDIKYWRLEVDGLVENPLTFDYEQLKKLPAVAQYLTLECISNPVGGDQIGNALWKGVRMRDLLLQAGAKSSAIKVVLYGEDEYSDSIALSKAMEEGTLLAYEMNGETLTNGHGFPVRLLVPGIYGMKNVKWLTRIELVDYDYRGYWQERGWSDLAAIKTMSRIDVPAGRESGLSFLELMDLFTTPEEEERELKIEQDSALLGGIAFAGDRGISQVEVSTDDGQTWNKAQVKEALSPYTWVLWVYDWRPPGEGKLTIKVRAADSKGNLQPSEPADPLPDGASGYHSIVVRLVKE